MNTPSNIYDFTDYRDFLKDRYRQLKETDPAFSFRYFSKQAGFGSPNYLKLVMDGKRNLSDEAIGKFAKGLRLDSHESEYFKFMVGYNQCEDRIKKEVYEAKLHYLRELFKVKELIPEHYDYYHDWYHAAIREMINNKGTVRNNPVVIAAKLSPQISEEDAANSISLLKKLGYVVENGNGDLQPGQGTETAVAGAEMAQKIYHEQMAELAAKSLYTQGSATQEFESVTVALPANKVAELKQKIKELVAEVSNEHGGEQVYQFNVQLFALTQEDGEETAPQPEVA
ncbi:MAG: TIGR02147 family protein [Bdellovibrionaceae bacterium]|nr:TIGR02147 family protein [Pseudobdellovibrionaceae bacterium]